jgi:hypothetical protein
MNTHHFTPESLKAAGQRFLLSQDGIGAAWVHPLELSDPRYEGWTDCTDMDDEAFERLVVERQHNTRFAALALAGA